MNKYVDRIIKGKKDNNMDVHWLSFVCVVTSFHFMLKLILFSFYASLCLKLLHLNCH